MSSLAHGLPGGIQAHGISMQPMQVWVSRSGGWVGQLLVIHTPWVAIGVVSSVAPTLNRKQQQHGWSLAGKAARLDLQNLIETDLEDCEVQQPTLLPGQRVLFGVRSLNA